MSKPKTSKFASISSPNMEIIKAKNMFYDKLNNFTTQQVQVQQMFKISPVLATIEQEISEDHDQIESSFIPPGGIIGVEENQ